MNNDLYKGLVKEFMHAVQTNDDCLVHITYGKASMAFKLDAISWKQFHNLSIAILRWMNAGDKRRANYATMIKAKDFR